MLEFLFNKVAGFQTCNFIERDSNTGEYYNIFKNTYFEKHLPTAASDFCLKWDSIAENIHQ